MNGHVLSGTPIAVDYWRRLKCGPGIKLFFLSHIHADHIVGLTKHWRLPIYTSKLNADLLTHKIGINYKLFRTLNLGATISIPVDHDGGETVQVTLLEANHCPGAVMFYFQGSFGTILYTGDFRYKPTLIQSSRFTNVDHLYLDNTYCLPECTFLDQNEATEIVLSAIASAQLKNQRVILAVDNLGKEELFLKIFEKFNTKVLVTENKMDQLKILGLERVATIIPDETWILVKFSSLVNYKSICSWKQEQPTAIIIPTARYLGLKKSTPYQELEDVHVIPYSLHSSFEELKSFVQCVRPKKITPIVRETNKSIDGESLASRTDMRVFEKLMFNESDNSVQIAADFFQSLPTTDETQIVQIKKSNTTSDEIENGSTLIVENQIDEITKKIIPQLQSENFNIKSKLSEINKNSIELMKETVDLSAIRNETSSVNQSENYSKGSPSHFLPIPKITIETCEGENTEPPNNSERFNSKIKAKRAHSYRVEIDKSQIGEPEKSYDDELVRVISKLYEFRPDEMFRNKNSHAFLNKNILKRKRF